MRLLSSSVRPDAPLAKITRYSFFHNALHIAGYLLSPGGPVRGLALLAADGRRFPLTLPGLPSPELTRRYGAAAAACRFDDVFQVGPDAKPLHTATLSVTLADGGAFVVPLTFEVASDDTFRLIDRFFAMLSAMPPGHCLEIGSRVRTGGIWKSALPAGWRYTGFDIMDGPNVDIVGDAHRASHFLPRRAYDAVMSFVVFEHLLMPWKVAIELNRVLKTGAIGIIAAPHTWPIHEEPCDYFRFSRHAWKALFNKATGFAILDAAQGSPAHVVPLTMTGPPMEFNEHFPTPLMSAVLFRKTGETALDWPVELDAVSGDVYPL